MVRLEIFGYRITVPKPLYGGTYIDGKDPLLKDKYDVAALSDRLKAADRVNVNLSIDAREPFSVHEFNELVQGPRLGLHLSRELNREQQAGDIRNRKLLAEIEEAAKDPDPTHFDEDGLRPVGSAAIPRFVMSTKRYARSGGRPFFFTAIGHTVDANLLYDPHIRVRYQYQASAVPRNRWAEFDRAVFALLNRLITPPDQPR